MPDLENFPVARDPTQNEVDYIEDVYRMRNYGNTFLFFIFMPSLSLFLFLFLFFVAGGDEAITWVLPIPLGALFIFSGVWWYATRRKTYTGESLREVRGRTTVGGARLSAYLHGRRLFLPDQWINEFKELKQPVHVLVYPLVEEQEWIVLEINGWLSVERDVSDDVVSTRTFLRIPGFNPLYWLRNFSRRYRRLRRKEQEEGLEDAYTESPD